MKNESIIQAIGYVDDDLVEAAFVQKHSSAGKKSLKLAIAAVIILALLTGAALAYTAFGGTFFKELFGRKAADSGKEYSYIDLEQLTELSGSTLGTVLDTDDLRVDIVDIVSSGPDLKIALKITAKQANSVDEYLFEGVTGTLFRKTVIGSESYIYSDEDDSLAQNQLYLVATATLPDGCEGAYSLILQNLGFLDTAQTTPGPMEFTCLVSGEWTIDLSLSGGTTHSMSIELESPVEIGEDSYLVERLDLSPFGFYLTVSYFGEADASGKRVNTVYNAADVSFSLCTGEKIDFTPPAVYTGSKDGKPASFVVIAGEFDVPVNVDEIAEMYAFGKTFGLK